MNIGRHLLNLFSGKDNQTLDLGRVLWFKGSLVFNALAIYHVVYNHAAFDYNAYALGFGAILGAGGAALWAKKDTEPPNGPA